MTRKYIDTTEETAQNIKIGDEMTIDGETYTVKAKYVTKSGAEIELEKRTDFQSTIELGLDEAINLDNEEKVDFLDEEIRIQ